MSLRETRRSPDIAPEETDRGSCGHYRRAFAFGSQRLDADLKHPAEWMAVEQVTELQILAEDLVALVPAEPLQLRRTHASVQAGRQRAAFEAVAADLQAREASRNRARLNDQCQGACRQCVRTEPGQGRGSCFSGGRTTPAASARHMRRNTGPSMMPEAAIQRSKARTGHSSVSPYGSGTVTSSVWLPFV